MASKPKEKIKSKKKSSGLAVIIIVLVLAGGVAMAVLFPYVTGDTAQTTTVKIPLIMTKLTSAKDGNDYNVQTQFSVKIDNSAKKTISQTLLNEALVEIMAGMDMDMVAAPGGIDYINQRATEELNTYLSDYTDTKVFVTGLFVGDKVMLADGPSQQEENMKGLFNKIE